MSDHYAIGISYGGYVSKWKSKQGVHSNVTYKKQLNWTSAIYRELDKDLFNVNSYSDVDVKLEVFNSAFNQIEKKYSKVVEKRVKNLNNQSG